MTRHAQATQRPISKVLIYDDTGEEVFDLEPNMTPEEVRQVVNAHEGLVEALEACLQALRHAPIEGCYGKDLRKHNSYDAMRAALEELLPMQGCINCQEVYSACSLHGDIRKTVAKAEAALAQAQG